MGPFISRSFQRTHPPHHHHHHLVASSYYTRHNSRKVAGGGDHMLLDRVGLSSNLWPAFQPSSARRGLCLSLLYSKLYFSWHTFLH